VISVNWRESVFSRKLVQRGVEDPSIHLSR
jgi:hypothetical protein